ncbi:MAG: FmdB family zinc ribbon protein [Planctomycetota bacterium]
MPTYEYVCNACGHAFEEFQSITAKPLRKCPECNKLKLQRLIGTGAGIIFKGSGFYETDYRSENYAQGKKADADAKKPKESKSETASSNQAKPDAKSENKPAAKTESKTNSSKSNGKSKN